MNNQKKSRSLAAWLVPISLLCMLCVTPARAETWNQARKCCNSTVQFAADCWQWARACKLKVPVAVLEQLDRLLALNKALPALLAKADDLKKAEPALVEASNLAKNLFEKARDTQNNADPINKAIYEAAKHAYYDAAYALRNHQAAVKAAEAAAGANRAEYRILEGKIKSAGCSVPDWVKK